VHIAAVDVEEAEDAVILAEEVIDIDALVLVPGLTSIPAHWPVEPEIAVEPEAFKKQPPPPFAPGVQVHAPQFDSLSQYASH